MRLNDEQRKLVEDNHNLIYFVGNKYVTNVDDYYDILAISLCKSAYKFKPELGFSFTTFAVKVMSNELFMEFRKNSRRGKFESSWIPTLEYRTDGLDNFDQMITWDLSKLSKVEFRIMKLLYEGKNQTEIANELGYKQGHISRMIRRCKVKLGIIEGD